MKKAVSKRKRRSRRKKPGAVKILMLLGTFLLLGAAAWLVLNLHSGKPHKTRPVTYEEVHRKPPAPVPQVSKIDSALRACLNRNRVPKEQVRFLSVRQKREKGVEWEFTEIAVHVAKGASRDLDEDIRKTLASLKPQVTYRSEGSETEKTYHVFATGFYTHKIRLVPPEPQNANGNKAGEPKRVLARVAIIIDDIGHDVDLAKSFTQLAFPVTLSILPLAPHTQAIVQTAKKAGCEYMLHLPMEPKDYPASDPGPGALFTTMTDEEIRQALTADLRQVPGAVGVNNHMGSEFTENEGKMSALLHELKRRGLFYVDSRTTSLTVAHRLATSLGVLAASRTVFLDNDPSPRAIEFQIKRLMAASQETGTAIGIGHPHKATLNAIKAHFEGEREEARVVPVSRIVG